MKGVKKSAMDDGREGIGRGRQLGRFFWSKRIMEKKVAAATYGRDAWEQLWGTAD